MDTPLNYDVLIIGAGPAGACAASLLCKKGYSVAIVEQQRFPRFSLGESLLPQCMTFLEEGGFLPSLEKANFQLKNGAAFLANGEFSTFNFNEKVTDGPSTTFQVQRATFDKVLADDCQAKGANILYRHSVTDVNWLNDCVSIDTLNLDSNQAVNLKAKFIIDASGNNKFLAQKLNIFKPSSFPNRKAVFAHMKTNFPKTFDMTKILITVDETYPSAWIWTIPFSNNTCSIGIVSDDYYFKTVNKHLGHLETIQNAIKNSPKLTEIMNEASFINDGNFIEGYASSTTTLYGDRFALIGNAGGFLDPVFSSGVTIALKAASIVSKLIDQTLQGNLVDWKAEYEDEMNYGINVFKAFVSTWYSGELQKVIFYKDPNPKIKAQISSILAGYVWDRSNPITHNPERTLKALANLIN